MKLIKPSVETLEQSSGLQGIYDMIELCGKTSYKSPAKGGDEAKKFVEARINEGHLAVLEFGTVYLTIPSNVADRSIWKILGSPYSKVHFDADEHLNYVTTNYRVIIEKMATDALQYLSEPTDKHPKRYCARIITDRGVSHELIRSRSMSFCQESTRYCNYSKDKFENEVTFIIPTWLFDVIEPCSCHTTKENVETIYKIRNKELRNKAQWFTSTALDTEKSYLEMLEAGCTPQEARQVLPNALKTEICMCGFEDDWKHFFDLRYRGTTGKPHPDMLNVATMLHNEFEKKGISL